MRIVYIGCVESSERMLRQVLQLREAEVVGIVTRRSSSFNADFASLEPLAEKNDIPCYIDTNNDQADLAPWIRERRPEVGYCFGWSYLLNSDVLSIPELGFIGFHPTKLPQNRGRHPIIWALALGLERTASSFFFMDEGADTGDLLSQRDVPIHWEDDARSLYDRIMDVAKEQVSTVTPQLAAREYPREPQDDERANYWRKRSREDGEIDWRMSSRSVYNLVRALAHPYPGAHCRADGHEIKIWSVDVIDGEFEDVGHLEPGKVLVSDAETVSVKCGEGVIEIQEHEFDKLPDEGDYLQ
ncbi:formyltransferase family protein [Salinibacter ruber]|uniref:formyltransferase family protein n=1 Tax=Salinibacter ruber TaxID=146919 RepID=UPI002169014F|nr:formyltransferase family protein [Salinibacter ruber]MCS4039530.1 methionyl-tRNA formyltransferase [Salinibacter ruber]